MTDPRHLNFEKKKKDFLNEFDASIVNKNALNFSPPE
jgi:hypothetical protein